MSVAVLLVEDTFALRRSLTVSLRAAGLKVVAVGSAEEAAEAARSSPPDVVVLDWNLPGQSGLELLREWRAEGHDHPVILLTARDAIADRVTGLEAGANDYLVKPFATEELIARVHVQLRQRKAVSNMLELERCRVDLGRQQLERDGQVRPLTTKEAEVLAYLSERPGQAVSRDELHREIWGHGDHVISRSVDNTVLRLRPKIEADIRTPRHLITVHGMGYRFEP